MTPPPFPIRRALDAARARQGAGAAHPDLGALVSPDTGLPLAYETAVFAAACVLAARGLQEEERPPLLLSAREALEYLFRAARPGGLVDLPLCNPDSAPDTAFSLQPLAAAALLERARPSGSPEAAAWAERAAEWIGRTAPAVARGGFHTPNHRWVIASALALSRRLVPALAPDVEPVLRAYLAEGFDLDPDGFWLERSIGVYDGVTNRALLLLHEFGEAPEALTALDAVRRNLETNLFLIHGDGTAETALSIRQDAGKRLVPLGLADSYLRAGRRLGEPRFLAAAAALLEAADASAPLDLLFWIGWTRAWNADPDPLPRPFLPERYWRVFPTRRAARHREGRTEATVLAGSPSFLRFLHGRAEIAGVRFFQGLHGVGLFSATEWETGGGRVWLATPGRRRRRPGYEQPLGRPVPWDRWEEALEERPLRPLPAPEVRIELTFEKNRLEGRLRTPGALPGLLAQLAFDVAPDGVVELDGGTFSLRAGQELFLERGMALLRYGTDTIRIGPGNRAHRAWAMRDMVSPGPLARIVIPFLTPVDAAFTLEGESSPPSARGAL